MALIWNRVTVDNTVDKFFKFQNKSQIPDSKVHVMFSKDKPTESTGHVIASRQFLNIVVMSGEVIWFAEETGGVFTFSCVDQPKLENYNIESVHRNITITGEPVRIQVPEGSTLTFQNLSKSNVGASIGADNNGAFILSQFQIFAESFPKNDIVTIIPDTNGTTATISYSITQSAIITQLSPSAQNEINTLKAAVELVMQYAATKDELDAISARLYHNTWSKANFIQRSNTKMLTSYPFVGNIPVYHSRGIQDNSGFEIMFDLNVTYEDENNNVCVERGIIYAKGLYKNSGRGSLMISESTNINISKLIEQININVSANRNEIVVGLSLYKNVLTAGLTSVIKFEHNYFEPFQGEISDVEHITGYTVDLINTGVDVSDKIVSFTYDLLDKIINNRQEVKFIVLTKATSTEDNAGHISDVLTYTLNDDQYLKIVRDDEGLLELRTKVKSENLSTLFRPVAVIKSNSLTEYQFTTNIANLGIFVGESVEGNYRIQVTKIPMSRLNQTIFNRLTSIPDGNEIKISFREEV